MTTQPPFFGRQRQNINLQSTDDEDQNKNLGNLKGKKVPCIKDKKMPLNTSKNQTAPLTSYRAELSNQQKENLKWQYLTRFFSLASKAHYIYDLKFQTLFLSYSLAERTVSLIGDSLSFQYWTACCLFMSMKYEEIYPPRLKDLSTLVKTFIKPEVYSQAELKILEFIGLDMAFISLNTMLSQVLHAVKSNPLHKYFIFFLLEIALLQRSSLKKFTTKELLLSVMFVLSSHRLYFYANDIIDGIKFQHIEQCSKYIIINQIHLNDRFPNLFKKYKSDKYMMVAYGSLPTIQALTILIQSKAGQQQQVPRLVGLSEDFTEQELERLRGRGKSKTNENQMKEQQQKGEETTTTTSKPVNKQIKGKDNNKNKGWKKF